jgi:hypothetical protein
MSEKDTSSLVISLTMDNSISGPGVCLVLFIEVGPYI